MPFAVWLVAACAMLPARGVRFWLVVQAGIALAAVNRLLLTTW